MFASRSAPVKFLVLRVTLETVKTPVAIMPIAIFGHKFINEMINEDEKAAEMSVQYRVIPIRFLISPKMFLTFI
jgi:hypothetical protein